MPAIYDRLVAGGKKYKVATFAVMSKLAVLANVLLRHADDMESSQEGAAHI
ncbi:MAG: hypothetical protein OXI87_15000 [Albidovulum sp.]|nr:hypothetical protein [Albidovulum sp.]